MHEAFTTFFLLDFFFFFLVWFVYFVVAYSRWMPGRLKHKISVIDGAQARATRPCADEISIADVESWKEISFHYTFSKSQSNKQNKKCAGIIVIINTFEYILLISNRPSAKWSAVCFLCWMVDWKYLKSWALLLFGAREALYGPHNVDAIADLSKVLNKILNI